MAVDQLLLVRALAALCTCSLVLFLTASSAFGQFAAPARVGYFGVYLTGAAACLAASRAVRAHIVRWQWLTPAIASIPLAIVVARWSVTASDLIALLFYPFAMLTAARPFEHHPSRATKYRSLDALMVCGAALTATLFVWARGVPDPALYRLLAPAAAVSLVVPALPEALRGLQRQSHPGLGLLVLGVLVAVLTDVTPASVPFSGFTWAGAVWMMAVAAAVASTRRSFSENRARLRPFVPQGCWPVCAVAGVYAIVAVELQRIDSKDVRLLLIGGTVLTALVVVRQFVALRENDELISAKLANEARFRALVQHSFDAYLILDARGRIAYHSPALPRLTARTETDCAGLPFVDLLSPNTHSTVAAMLAYVGQCAGRSHRTAVSVRLGDNRTREIELVAINRSDEPAIDGVVLTMRDITERVQLERQLARQDKMDAVDRMASGVAHEFNNVLAVIMGNVDALSLGSDRDAATRQALGEIRHAVTRAAELSRALLGVSRQRPLTETTIDLNESLRRVERMLRSGMGPEYAVILRLDPGLWPAQGDEEDLEHVLLNLALNARDAMPGGGTLTIDATNVPAAQLPASTALPRQDYLQLTVADTGLGMSQEVMDRAFDPFFSTKPEGRGTGLGLAFVSAAIRRIGGFIEVSSTIGVGTTFVLWLPRAGSPGLSRGRYVLAR